MASTPDPRRPGRRSLLERFPALRRLGNGRSSRRIPYVQQTTQADCGAACLAMVLAWYGREVRLREVRELLDVGRDGASALGLIRAAAHYGLRGRGIALDVDDLDYLPRGAVLHWGFFHYVVYESHDAKGVQVVDPALGRRRVPWDEFRKEFTGVALLFEPTEEFRTGGRRDRPVWRYVRRLLLESGLLVRILVVSALVQVFGLGLPLLTGMLVDRLIPTGDLGLMAVLAAGMAALVLFHFLATYIRSHLLLYLRTRLDAGMTLDFLEHLFALPFAFFQSRSAGDLMMRLNSNRIVREIVTSAALSSALDGVLVLSYLVLMIWISPLLGGLAILLGLLRVAVFLLSRHRIRDLTAESLARQAKSEGYQVQMFAAVETLKAAGAEPRALDRWSRLFVDVLNVEIARGRLDAVVQAAIGALAFASPVILLIAGGYLVITGRLSLGTMLAVNAMAGAFLAPLSSLVQTALRFQQLGGYVDRLDDVLATPREQESGEVVPAPRLKGEIVLDAVTFHYHESAPPAVDGVSAAIPAGSMVAIVGPSAAGKSTLAKLMLGLYRPTAGRILYDGRDLAGLEVRSVRCQVGVVTQHTQLFGSSIRDNITLADPDLPLAAVERAARLAHIHDDIAALPLGYDTVLSDGGLSLSGGQRQRIALARALVRDPVILLLDEATSSLDARTERLIQQSLAELRITRIVIAHRLSTVREADLILVLDKGRLVEQGTHAELLRRGGLYAELAAGRQRRAG